MSRAEIGLILASALLSLLFVKDTLNTNSESRFATIESLIEKGTFVINDATYGRALDKAQLENGDFVSEKPPLLSVIGAAAFWIYTKTTGRNFRTHEAETIYWMQFLLGWIPFVLLLYVFAKTQALIFSDKKTRLIGLSLFGFCFLGMAYSTTLTNHVPAALSVMLSFYFLKRGHYLASGFFAGLAPTLDLPSLFVALGMSVYLLMRDRGRLVREFLPMLLIPVSIHFVLNYIVCGSVLPLYFRHDDLIAYPGSYWANPVGLDAMNDSFWVYFLQITLGFRGVFSITPVLALGFWELVKRRRGGDSQWIFWTFVGLLLFYTFVSTNKYGGTCIGFRFLIFFMPLLFISVAQFLDRPLQSFSRLKQAGLVVLVGLSLYQTMGALVNPWRNGELEKSMKAVGLLKIPN